MAKKDGYKVAVVGAMGVVGREMMATLERRKFPIAEFRPLDISAHEGKTVEFGGKTCTIKTANFDNFKDIDIAIFSAGGDASLALTPKAVKQGAIVIDNSSVWRMDPDCPLVVPEVNPEDVDWHNGIIANPNCSTIQMVVTLKPLHDYAKVKRVIVSTYQAVSGSGKAALDGLDAEIKEYVKYGEVKTVHAYGKQIAMNCLPHIDVFQEGGYTKEENKMVNETKKIMKDDSVAVTATCVRIPVIYGHSESLNVETEKKISADKARELFRAAEGLLVIDNPDEVKYPVPCESDNEDLTMVGRIREDNTKDNALNMWCVSNNIRKGAALNAVQIAETLVQRGIV